MLSNQDATRRALTAEDQEMAAPDTQCPFYGDPECWCRKHDGECPFDGRPLTDEQLRRTVELAKQRGWKSE